MSRAARLHDLLENLFESKDSSLLPQILEHSDYLAFMQKHGLEIPVRACAEAFTHTSFTHEFEAPHQEQLEFLGDSVLQLILTDELFKRFPKEKEGKLSKMRSALVNEKTLFQIGEKLGLPALIIVGKGEYKKNLFEQAPVVADTMEALLAQIYRYQGMDKARVIFLGWLTTYVSEAFTDELLNSFDAKSKLQEMSLARYKKLPRYSSEAKGDGFEVSLWINEELVEQGIFHSKKIGEKELAQNAIKKGNI